MKQHCIVLKYFCLFYDSGPHLSYSFGFPELDYFTMWTNYFVLLHSHIVMSLVRAEVGCKVQVSQQRRSAWVWAVWAVDRKLSGKTAAVASAESVDSLPLFIIVRKYLTSNL